MGIKWKLLAMVGLPIAAIAIIFVVGLTSFYVIDSSISSTNSLHMDRATMLDADRDAYQAQMAVMESLTAESIQQLSAFRETSNENLQQTWDRIIGPSEQFSQDMQNPLEEFKQGYGTWKQHNDAVFELSAQTLQAKLDRSQAEEAALTSFDSMRNTIDQLGEMIGNLLKNPSLDIQRRTSLESALSAVLNADRDAYQAYVAQLLIIRADDIKKVNSLAESFTENVDQARDRVLSGADIAGGAALALKDEFLARFTSWEENSRKVVELTRETIDENIERRQLIADSEAGFSRMRGSIDKLGEKQVARVEQKLEELDSAISATILVYIIVAAAFIVISVIVTLIVASRIATVMRQSADVATALSEGDFSVTLDVQRNDEVGQLADAISRMIDKLSEIVRDVQDASSTVAASSEELAGSAETLSQGATEQAAAVEEVSSAMEEMASSIGKNTESSGETEEIARHTASEARKGGIAVKKTVESMTQIADKISIIEEIARQTNLLALNAAIEAARAGEHGKGFAVVAAEVRKLAEKSGQAANEISELSSDSVEVATQAGQMLDSIVPNIEKTSELIQEIASASGEQNNGADEINKALQQMDNVVQANAGSSEEIASTAEEMSSQAVQLEKVMAFFKLRARKAKAGPSASAPAPPKKLEAPKSQGLALEMGEDDDSFERF